MLTFEKMGLAGGGGGAARGQGGRRSRKPRSTSIQRAPPPAHAQKMRVVARGWDGGERGRIEKMEVEGGRGAAR